MAQDRTDDPAEASYRKRSVAVSLVFVAGASVAAIALDRWDRSGSEEEVLVYESLAACLDQRQREAEACAAGYREAEAAYRAGAPRYATADDCRVHHGADGCAAGGTVAQDAAGLFVPVMAGYMIGRTAGQGLPVQPLYRHAPDREAGGAAPGGAVAGGYRTGAGGRVPAGGGGPATRVSSSVARAAASSPRMIAQGGFGGTGRALSFGGQSGSSGG